MRKGLKQKVLLLLMALMLLTLALSACGRIAAGKVTIKTADDLAKKKIGVQLGTTGDIYASDYEKKGATMLRYNKAADAIEALKQGKIDCVVLDQSPAQVFVSQNKDLSIVKEDFVTEDYAICLAKNNDALKDKINQAIADLKKDHTIDTIISNYIGDDTKGKHPYVSPDNVKRTNGELVVSTNAEFEPYEYMQDDKVVGIDIDLMQAICDKLGMSMKLQNIAFDSIITSVESGKSDVGIAGMTITKDRLKSIDFTTSYTTSKQVIIVRNGKSQASSSFMQKLKNNFITEHRYIYIAKGLGTTLLITVFAVMVGIIFGFLIGILRTVCDDTGKFKVLNLILKGYLTIIRGTPTMIQLLIIYYVIFATSDINKVVVAVIAFGVNSSAYIAEIVRSGINSIEQGQFEAARSMGFPYASTMRYFILPLAVKNVLPALGNEFIVLLKETSISGYIGIMDLTRGGDYIRSRTYEAFMPLIAVALIYLIIVVLLSMGVSKMERRLRANGQ